MLSSKLKNTLKFYDVEEAKVEQALAYLLADPQAKKLNVSAKGAYVQYAGCGVLYPWTRLAEIAKDLA